MKKQQSKPKGRPKGSKNKGTQRLQDIVQSTVDFEKVIGQVLQMINDTSTKTSDRLSAINLLLDRGYGKATNVTEATITNTNSNLSDNRVSSLLDFMDELETQEKKNYEC